MLLTYLPVQTGKFHIYSQNETTATEVNQPFQTSLTKILQIPQYKVQGSIRSQARNRN